MYYLWANVLIVDSMNFEVLNIVVTSTAVVKMFFFFAAYYDKWLDTFITKQVDDIMKKYSFTKNQKEVRAMVTWVVNEEFTLDTIKRKIGSIGNEKLGDLKDEFLDFYLGYLSDVSSISPEFERNCDIQIRIEKYILQIMRLRMVIEPEIQIAMNKHTQTNHEYIAVKSFWLNDEGVKVRKFTKSLGRVEDYEKGLKDPKVREEGIVKIQEIMYETYLEEYPE